MRADVLTGDAKQRIGAGFYPKLAFTNLRKNSKVYVPYLFTCIVTIAMFYVMSAIAKNEGIDQMPGAQSMHLIMKYAMAVIEVFAAIFLFYTNSILNRQRKRELGLYHVLGMDKGNLAHMLAWESLFTAALGLTLGLLFGILLGKLMFLILLKLIRFPVPLSFAVEPRAALESAALFLTIFLLCFLWNVFQMWKLNPIELLHAGKQGEREPKGRLFLTILGAAALGYGYYIAQTTDNPVDAILKIFLAVLLVIFGTYVLFLSGSVTCLKLLKKKKSYYYHPRHFTVVSGLIYRMKQNAAGLANICVMSCAVLALLFVTLSLYLGVEDIIDSRYPREYSVSVYGADEERVAKAQKIVEEELERFGVEKEEEYAYHAAVLTVMRDGDRLLTDVEEDDIILEDLWGIYLIPLADYNTLEGKNVSLADGEILLYTDGAAFETEQIMLGEHTYQIKEQPEKFVLAGEENNQVVEVAYLIMKDAQAIQKLCGEYTKGMGADAFMYSDAFDLNGDGEACRAACTEIGRRLSEEVGNAAGFWRETFQEQEYVSVGGFLFLGIFVGLLFLVGTILVIYYKQIAEGYEDRERFQIMKKVGMSQSEIRMAIRSQVLLVFFLPLGTAIVHMIFAFHIFSKALEPFGLYHTALEAGCLGGVMAVFAVFYVVVFLLTSREYYRIVR